MTKKAPDDLKMFIVAFFSQENGSLLLIFDAIGFELDLVNEKQSTFVAPDSSMFNLVPGSSGPVILMMIP